MVRTSGSYTSNERYNHLIILTGETRWEKGTQKIQMQMNIINMDC